MEKKQSRVWGVTTWSDDPPCYDVENMRYMMRVQHEAPDTGRKHWHALITFAIPRRMSYVKKIISDNTAHCKVLRNEDTSYLEDGHTAIRAPEEFGEKKKKGQRSDLDAFKRAIEAGASMRTLATEHFGCWLKYEKMIGRYRMITAAPVVSKFTLDQFAAPPITEWDKHVHLYGPHDTGKTQYSLAHFKCPLYVRHVDHLCYFDATEHDGVVVDELSFKHWPISAVINMLNKKDPAMVHVRYNVAHLPAGVKIIFCSNERDIWFDEQKNLDGLSIRSVLAKIDQIYVDKRLF